MASFQLTLFGSFLAQWQGHSLAFRSDKIRALLAYLVVESEQVHDRVMLANLLWSEKTDRDAHNNLRVSLSRLRRSLQPVSQALGYSVLEIGTQAVQLQLPADARTCHIDVRVFDELVRACETHPHRALDHCQVCNRRLRQAVALYQGEFLAGLSAPGSPIFTEWQRRWQERYHAQVVMQLRSLAVHDQVLGNLDLSERYWRRLLQLVPWDEMAHRQLMLLLAQRGEREGALAQFEQCRQILNTEFGVAPGAETTELMQAIAINNEMNRQHHTTRRPATLPQPLTPFVGRSPELHQLKKILLDPAYRLAVITGPGGAGKTRLALAVAEQVAVHFGDGVRPIFLADVNRYGQDQILATAIAQALELELDGKQSAAEKVLACLQTQDVLLLLDNLEHLLSEEAFLVELMRRTQRVTLLITSRERLAFQAAYTLNLSGLPVPPAGTSDANNALRYGSVQLFMERASRQPQASSLGAANVSAVVEICQRVEGLPLALELAAAWAGYLSYAELNQAVADNMDTLAVELADMPARQRSIRATFDSSWQLLSANLQHYLQRLAVFRGGFTREAALALAGATQVDLNTLIDKSLLRRSEEGRYSWHPLVQQFANEKLSHLSEGKEVHRQHAYYYLTFVADQELALTGWRPREAITRIYTEWDNIQKALSWSAAHGEQALIESAYYGLSEFFVSASLTELGISIFDTLKNSPSFIPAEDSSSPHVDGSFRDQIQLQQARCLLTQGSSRAALEMVDEVLAHGKRGEMPANVFIDAYLHKGRCLQQQAQYEEAQIALEQALQLAESAQALRAQAHILGNLAVGHGIRAQFVAAYQYIEKAQRIAAEIGHRRLLCNALSILASLYLNQANYVQAMEVAHHIVEVSREIAFPVGEGQGFYVLVVACRSQGRLDEAQKYAQQGLALMQELGHPYEQMVIRKELALIANECGRHSESLHGFREILQMESIARWPREKADTLNLCALVFCHLGDFMQASLLTEQAEALAHEIGLPELAFYDAVKGCVLVGLGRFAEAVTYCQDAWNAGVSTGNRHSQASALTYLGHAYAGREQWDMAAQTYRQAIELRQQMGQRHRVVEAQAGLAQVLFQNGRQEEARALVDSIWHTLQAGEPNGIEDVGNVYLICYHTLLAQDERGMAASILEQAYRTINDRAANITDTQHRHSYLYNVSANREITIAARNYKRLRAKG